MFGIFLWPSLGSTKHMPEKAISAFLFSNICMWSAGRSSSLFSRNIDLVANQVCAKTAAFVLCFQLVVRMIVVLSKPFFQKDGNRHLVQ